MYMVGMTCEGISSLLSDGALHLNYFKYLGIVYNKTLLLTCDIVHKFHRNVKNIFVKV